MRIKQLDANYKKSYRLKRRIKIKDFLNRLRK